VADEKPEKKTDRGVIPKSTQREKARAAIEAILSTGKHQLENSSKDVIKPFVIENSQKNSDLKIPIPIKTIEPANATKIPELDLDQKIMADQRREVTTSRKGPGQKTEIGKQPIKTTAIEHLNIWQGKTVNNRKPLGSKNVIIKEIVAKDIAKIYQKHVFKSNQK